MFGAVCTARLGFANKYAFKLAQLQAKDETRKVRFAIWTKRQAFLTAHPELNNASVTGSTNSFVQDVLRKLDQYGSLSGAQVSAVIRAVTREAAQQATEVIEVKGEAPTGRVAVTGEVLSVQVRESDFGLQTKMLVKLANNAKVWCTAPVGVQRGQTITVKATWTPSKEDKSFAFGSRPTLMEGAAR